MYARGALKWLLIILLSITITVMLHNNIYPLCLITAIGLSVKDFGVERTLLSITSLAHSMLFQCVDLYVEKGCFNVIVGIMHNILLPY